LTDTTRTTDVVSKKAMDRIELFINSVLIQGSQVFQLSTNEMLAALAVCQERAVSKTTLTLEELLELMACARRELQPLPTKEEISEVLDPLLKNPPW